MTHKTPPTYLGSGAPARQHKDYSPLGWTILPTM